MENLALSVYIPYLECDTAASTSLGIQNADQPQECVCRNGDKITSWFSGIL